MKIVIDTNVLISGIFWSGPPSKILHAWQQEKFELALTPQIFEEYQRVAKILYKQYPRIEITSIIDLIARNAIIYEPLGKNITISRDPDDDKFIHCALAADAKYIISGDNDLLVLKNYFDIEIITPYQFVNKFLK